MNEFELKIIDVKPDEVRKKLKAIGAKKAAHLHYKRIIFPIKRKKNTLTWLRLRSDGKNHTLTLKINKGNKISSTKEYEINVPDFINAAKLLCNVFPERYYEENERELYRFTGAEITIEKVAFIPYYVEIESKSETEVEKIYKKLNLSGTRFGNVPTSAVYEHYGMNEFEICRRNNGKLAKLIKE